MVTAVIPPPERQEDQNLKVIYIGSSRPVGASGKRGKQSETEKQRERATEREGERAGDGIPAQHALYHRVTLPAPSF